MYVDSILTFLDTGDVDKLFHQKSNTMSIKIMRLMLFSTCRLKLRRIEERMQILEKI